MIHIAKNWINGQWLSSKKIYDSINPSTYEVIGQYADATLQDAQSAIDAAKHAFYKTNWKNDRHLRSKVLNELANAFESHMNELIQILSTENGKITSEASFEVTMVPSKLRYYAALTMTEYGRALEPKSGSFSMVLRQPIGVAGIIVPWNSPVILFIRSLAPALAAGATVAVKMPGQTAQTNNLIAQVISKVPSLPTGVINIFSEIGSDGSKLLVESPDVPVISFTGSTVTGRAISSAGAKHLKRFGLELGGKTPMIVFNDADLNAVVPKLEKALTIFSGQFCMTGSRLLVQRGIANELRNKIATKLEQVKVGPANDPLSDMGPLIDKKNVDRVNQVVENAIKNGAQVLVRGGPIAEGKLSQGAFYKPTLLEVTDNKLEIIQKETFGPVLTLQVFDTEAEAISLANDCEYGLAASIWTRDVDLPLRVARDIEAGTIWINDWAVIYDEFEEGGFKQSGLGRLNGIAAMDDFIEYKHITITSGVVENMN